MGFGIGIGIGWPMTSSSRGSKQGWFKIEENCLGKKFAHVYSQQLLFTDYSEGDYVFFPEGNIRVLLGPFFEVLPDPNEIIEISGPAYANCGVFVRFNIEAFCDEQPRIAGCSNPVDSSIYNTGDYVFCDNLGIKVLLGDIVPDGNICPATYSISGPVYNSCTEGLVRYQIIQCCNQFLPEGAATQLVNSNLYTYGDYVYSPSLDSRVTLGSITESVEVEYQIQGPAFNGCE